MIWRSVAIGLFTFVIHSASAYALQEVQHVKQHTQGTPAWMKKRGVLFGYFGVELEELSTFKDWTALVGASVEFPLHQTITLGPQLSSGVFFNAAFIEAGLLMRIRIPLNDSIAWQMPFQLGIAAAINAAPVGASGAISLTGIEFFLTDRFAMILSAAQLNFFHDILTLTLANIGFAYAWD